MKKCAIITTYIEGELLELLPNHKDYFIIAADGGVAHALEANVHLDLIIGDFDSYDGLLPPEIENLRYPVEKDDTDSGICLSYAIEHGFTEIIIIGGIGGRLDHTIANIQYLCNAALSEVSVEMRSKCNSTYILRNKSIDIPKKENAGFAVFSMTEKSKGVSIKNAYYELDNYELIYNHPLGCSNHFLEGNAHISVKEGTLLIVVSDK